MSKEIKKKETFLESKGFKYLSGREIWKSEAGEISREFVNDHSLREIIWALSKAEKIAEITKKPFKLYNF